MTKAVLFSLAIFMWWRNEYFCLSCSSGGVLKKSNPVSPIARTRGFLANSWITCKSFSKSSTTGASFGCSATAANTLPTKASAHLTDQIDCYAEYPT